MPERDTVDDKFSRDGLDRVAVPHHGARFQYQTIGQHGSPILLPSMDPSRIRLFRAFLLALVTSSHRSILLCSSEL